jgi:hypothetical protein
MLDPWPSKNGGLPPWTDRPTMDRWGLLMSIRRIAQALLQESHAFLTNVWKRGKNGCQMGAKWVPLFAIISLVQLVLGFSIPYQSISSWTSQNSRVQKNRKPSRDPVPNGDELPGFCQMCVLDSATFEGGHNFREKLRISTKWVARLKNLTVEFGECSWCFMGLSEFLGEIHVSIPSRIQVPQSWHDAWRVTPGWHFRFAKPSNNWALSMRKSSPSHRGYHVIPWALRGIEYLGRNKNNSTISWPESQSQEPDTQVNDASLAIWPEAMGQETVWHRPIFIFTSLD